MRMSLHLSPPKQRTDFNYLYFVKGFIHRTCGDDPSHREQSFYNFGKIRCKRGFKPTDTAFAQQGATLDIAFWDAEMPKRFLMGVFKDPNFIWGMRINEIRESPTPNFGDNHLWLPNSPILLRKARLLDGQYSKQHDHVIFNQDATLANQLLTEKLCRKAERLGLVSDGVTATFEPNHTSKSELIAFKGTKLRTNRCGVRLIAPPEVQHLVWLTGLGELTGSGFGMMNPYA